MPGTAAWRSATTLADRELLVVAGHDRRDAVLITESHGNPPELCACSGLGPTVPTHCPTSDVGQGYVEPARTPEHESIRRQSVRSVDAEGAVHRLETVQVGLPGERRRDELPRLGSPPGRAIRVRGPRGQQLGHGVGNPPPAMSTKRTPGPLVHGECSAGSSLTSTGRPLEQRLEDGERALARPRPRRSRRRTGRPGRPPRPDVTPRKSSRSSSTPAGRSPPTKTIRYPSPAAAATWAKPFFGTNRPTKSSSGWSCGSPSSRAGGALRGVTGAVERGVHAVAEHVHPLGVSATSRVPAAMNSSIGSDRVGPGQDEPGRCEPSTTAAPGARRGSRGARSRRGGGRRTACAAGG